MEAAVRHYMEMLLLHLSGQRYNKAEYRRALLLELSGRSHGSVELKHQNISAVLNEMGMFWIPGYKPRGNYQGLLAEEVTRWLQNHPEFDRAALAAAEAPVVVPGPFDFSGFVEPQPELAPREYRVKEAKAHTTVGFLRDYVAREARNISLGVAGEMLALRYEQERLSRSGHDRLAGKVEHVSKKRGDGLGFDILSFEPTGEERFIEVKTTAFAKETPFFATAAEAEFARSNSSQYHLHRLFQFKSTPRCFVLPGPLERNCVLNGASFRCSFR